MTCLHAAKPVSYGIPGPIGDVLRIVLTSLQGKVKWDVYKEYAKASNLYAVAIYLVTLLGAKTAEIGKSTSPLRDCFD